MSTAIFEAAEKLGKMIQDSPQATALRTARAELKKHPDLEQLLSDYGGQADKIAQMEHDKKPIEVEDKRRLQELHQKLIANDVFKKLTAAQVEYIDLMRRVNESLRKQLSTTEAE